MRRIGLIGGITWAATAEYYRRINADIHHRLGGRHCAEMLIRSLDLHPLMDKAERIEEVSATFESIGQELLRGGAGLLAVASFTGHRYAGGLRAMAAPFIDLPAAVAARIRSCGYRHMAIWATSYALGDEQLLSQLLPGSTRLLTPPPEQRAQLDAIVFDELGQGRLTPRSLELLRLLLSDQVRCGAEALLLATTDFSPVAARLEDLAPILDATEIHCSALVDAALA